MIFWLGVPLIVVLVFLALGLIAYLVGTQYYGYDGWLSALSVLVWGVFAVAVFWSAEMAEDAEWANEP